MDSQSISALKATMPAVLRNLRDRRRPLQLASNGCRHAVLHDVASYESNQDAIALLKMILLSERHVAARRGSSTKDVLARLRSRVRLQGEADAS